MICKGQDVFSGETIELEFDRAILGATAAAGRPRRRHLSGPWIHRPASERLCRSGLQLADNHCG